MHDSDEKPTTTVTIATTTTTTTMVLKSLHTTLARCRSVVVHLSIPLHTLRIISIKFTFGAVCVCVFFLKCILLNREQYTTSV